MKKKKKDDFTDDRGLWARPDIGEQELTEGQIGLLTTSLEQNLEHARHVENERLTFNSIYMALAGGVLAFVYSTSAKYLYFAIIVTILLIITGFIAMNLTKRWDNAFDRHIEFAKGDYFLLHTHLFPGEPAKTGLFPEQERVPGLQELPLYCFRPHNPDAETGLFKSVYTIRTRNLFTAFYVLIQGVLVISLIYLLMQL